MRNNYIEILRNKVEIPIIQRDYAQGRTDNKTNKIRKEFLDVLFDFISKKQLNPDVEIELDFIYGFNEQDSNNQTTFVPIDGQQRLTTLWLLYWFVSVKESISEDEIVFLSNFLYETRHSTTEFYRNLIRFKPTFSQKHINEEITNQAWYFETWDFDPSIQAMLVVLKDIELRYNVLKINSVWSIIRNSPFYFYKLDMDKVGLTDDLYIKMNSRGKPLTEFEYFKAGFAEIILEPKQRKRFEKSIDGIWVDTVWHIIFELSSLSEDDDIALSVDNSFLNLFNFITSIISFKEDLKDSNDLRYANTVESTELLKTIYSTIENQNFLFDTLDAICKQERQEPAFWNNLFYIEKDNFDSDKTRLFFQHKDTNLLKRCLFHYSDYRGLSFPEQILLLACFTHLKTPSNTFNKQIRILRNLVVNSENELRESVLGNSFAEAEHFIKNGELAVFKTFKTDQIEEEKSKNEYINQTPTSKELLLKLEDSEIFRGSISLFPLVGDFNNRAEKFLELFDENEIISDFSSKSNLLLSFGDYSQGDGTLTNLMSDKSRVVRNFLTTPGYNKSHFHEKTGAIVLECLDFFIANPAVSIQQKIEEILSDYSDNPKDWRYYFMKYSSFRENCNQGYYSFWKSNDYCIWKMKERQFNGWHWDPFLRELINSKRNKNISLDNYGAKLIFSHKRKKVLICSVPNGFLFENGMTDRTANNLLEELEKSGVIDNKGNYIVPQSANGIDLQDRIALLEQILTEMTQT
ncbi:DUF262 domain-containing protein [Sphingobacterium sp.]|uniref:DUF262 domain-containing protein n=1 Tax=Sphingobacterium sp. TaxID=341027 RepID=UPI002583EC26|nr:DUF262 domain-containing protein [Sphingobacterium sp.]WET69085.1 MAG: DUF262 domain-containing protein [Sphingobacterium sp.]